MELSIPAHNVNPQNVYFLDKKRNIIVEGDFIKILYSTESYEMTGIYIMINLVTIKNVYDKGGFDQNVFRCVPQVSDETAIPITKDDQCWVQITSRSTINAKRIISFNPASKDNLALIDKLCAIERDIIDRYISEYCPLKLATYSLRTQLASGSIKYHSENKEHPENRKQSSAFQERCILKISGIWETATNVGITMKFILVH